MPLSVKYYFDYLCGVFINDMKTLTEFVCRHIGDDVTRLVLDKAKWPEIDMDLAVSCIESRRKLKGKVQEWYEEPELIFPRKLSAEQCSSSATGSYKAALASLIMTDKGREWRIADLTGGFGVDSWFFSKKAGHVLYNEMLGDLCDAARHNFSILKADNIDIRNNTAASGELGFLADFKPDMVYMDPARRGEGGKKVFLIEDCTPDVLTLKEEIFSYCRHIFIKLSPMADISMVCDRLGKHCREVHVVAAGGECKELLIWMDREWDEEYTIKAVELHDNQDSSFTFLPSEEKASACESVDRKAVEGLLEVAEGKYYLFEPGKALMKAGAFNLIGKKFGLAKLGKSTHYYLIDAETAENSIIIKGLGKLFRISRCLPLDKRSLKTAAAEFPKAEVTARNIPMDTDTLRKKLGVTSSDDAHIFGLKSDSFGNILLCTYRVL